MFKSEIRQSTINQLFEKAQNKNYGKYLSKVVLRKVRGFSEQVVNFEFPVTAVVGPNGGGKTTILGAAACAYASIKPRLFFTKSGTLDDSMQDWKIEFELIDKSENPKDTIKRTASFHARKWSRDAMNRDVVVFGVSRTVPASERPYLQKCGSSAFVVEPDRITQLSDNIAKAVAKILGKDVTGYSHIKVDPEGRVTLLSGKTSDGTLYSEFHFGAGESSVIRMVMKIESMADNSLILIEEIENGLHPVATVRMVEHLIDVAERKKCQVIFTTHSNDALRPLPSKAIWAAVNDKVFQGKLDINSLRAITGQIEACLAIFVEDNFAKIWLEAILRSHEGIAPDLIEIHAMEGDGIAVGVNKYHNIDPAAKNKPSICFIDGDSEQHESEADLIYRLPGQMPESFVFDTVLEAFGEYGPKLSVSLLRKYEEANKIEEICKRIRSTNRDPHVLFSQVGNNIGMVPESTVQAAFATIWAQAHPEKVKEIISKIENSLPK